MFEVAVSKHFQTAAVIVLSLVLLQTGYDSLVWDRIAIEQGEWWRVVSGHFVHLGWGHLAQNAVALIAMTAVFGGIIRFDAWLLLFAMLSLGLGLAFYIGLPRLYWYCGLSGVLHGVWMYASVVAIFKGSRAFGYTASFLLMAKLIVETEWPGVLLFTMVPVVTEAHILGTFGGGFVSLAYVLLLWTQRRFF